MNVRRAPGRGLVDLAMRAYPAAFRSRLGAPMRSDAYEALDEAWARSGWSWLRTVVFWCGDALLSGLAERASRRRTSRARSESAGGFRKAMLSAFGMDVRQALRRLRRTPGFAALVILTLALGIGLTTTAYHVANAVVFRPLGYPSPDRLVRVLMVTAEGREQSKVSAPDVRDWAERARTFESFAALDFGVVALADGGTDPEVVRSVHATPSVFEVLGVSAATGRLFTPADESGETDVVVLSDGLWRSRFGADPRVSGRTVLVDGRPRTVIGVLPADFEDPSAAESGQSQVWLPLTEEGAGLRGMRWLNAIGRLAEAVPIERAESDLSAVASALASEHPETNAGLATRLVPLRESIWGDAELPLLLLVLSSGLILLIACSNLANLMLARGVIRQREVAIRRAIGGGRGQVVRQVAVESALLATAGGAAGVAVTWLASMGIRALLDDRLQRMAVLPGARVLVLAGCLTLLTGVFIGILPGLRAADADPGDVLRESGRSASTGRRTRSIRNVLVGGQVAVALVLLVGAALLLRSFERLMRVDPGFDASGLLVWELSLPSTTYPDAADVLQFESELLDRLNAIPGASAGLVDKLPFGTRWGCAGFAIEGRPVPERPDDWPCADSRSVSAAYAAVMGLPLRRGRMLEASDDDSAEPVVVINETLAQQTWPDADPIGQRIAWAQEMDGTPVWRRVVGIVGDVRHRGLERAAQPEMYMPYEQAPDRRTSWVVRVPRGDPSALAGAVRNAIREVDRTLPLRDLRTFEATIAESVTGLRTGMLAIIGLSALALVIAVTGIYGVLAFFVAQRVPEFGLRLALGAEPKSIARLVVAEGMRTAGIGAAIGLLGALALSRVLSSILFGVRPTEPLSLIAVTLLLLSVAVLAAWLPARRALRVDPATALRTE